MRKPIYNWIFATLFAGMLAISAPAVAKDEIHSYKVYVGGLTVGTLNMSARIENGRYAAVAKVIGGGLIGAIFDLQFSGRSDGSVDGAGGFNAQKYTAEERDDGETKKRLLQFRGGTPTKVEFSPARKPRSYDIDPGKQRGTVDPITAALTLLQDTPAEKACGRSVEIFDGSKRTRIKLDKLQSGSDGSFACNGVFSRIAGYSDKQLAKQNAFPFTIHYKQSNDGLVVTKFDAASIFGRISAVRR